MSPRPGRGEDCCACLCDHDHPTVNAPIGGDRCVTCKWCHCREHGRQPAARRGDQEST